MISLSHNILEELNKGKPFALATILNHQGSTPRTSGSRMLVRDDGTIAGTIGGGLVEARTIETCREMMDKNRSRVMDFSLDLNMKEGLDMVCGGHLTVWLHSFVPPFHPDLTQIFRAVESLRKGTKKGFLITRVNDGEPQNFYFIDPTDISRGTSEILPRELLADIEDRKFHSHTPVRQFYRLEEFIIEPLLPRKMLYIFGAGHVGFQIGKMASAIDFSTVVIDDRPEFANPDRFSHADQILVVPDFQEVFKAMKIQAGSFIVILTRGHSHDQVVLEEALKTEAAYIGMIGSRKKRDRIYTNLMNKGIEELRLKQVHSPIGVQIRAETPAEIAVSIMGELIMERARLNDEINDKSGEL